MGALAIDAEDPNYLPDNVGQLQDLVKDLRKLLQTTKDGYEEKLEKASQENSESLEKYLKLKTKYSAMKNKYVLKDFSDDLLKGKKEEEEEKKRRRRKISWFFYF